MKIINKMKTKVQSKFYEFAANNWNVIPMKKDKGVNALVIEIGLIAVAIILLVLVNTEADTLITNLFSKITTKIETSILGTTA